MKHSRIGALLLVVLAAVLLPVSAFGAPSAARTYTLNVVLSPKYQPANDKEDLARIRYVLQRNGIDVISQDQTVSGNGPTFSYPWSIPDSAFSGAGTYEIVVYPTDEGSIARYQGRVMVSGQNSTSLTVTAMRLVNPFKLPDNASGDLMLLGGLALLVTAGALLTVRSLRQRRLTRLA